MSEVQIKKILIDEKEIEILRAYAQGMSIKKIAEAHGCHHETVIALIRRVIAAVVQ
ncbi:helix-turn-helix domain-containing protein [Candidatus Pyrohabitans sp.]